MTIGINSVQQVSITIAAAATTGTATINPAIGTQFLIFQGCTTSASAVQSEALCRVSLSGTTVTATRALGTLGTCVVNCAIVDATSDLVTSVQMGTITLSASTVGTATISSVTTTNSAVALLGYTSSLGTFTYVDNVPTIVLTNSTTVTASVNLRSGTVVVGYLVVNFELLDIKNGVISKKAKLAISNLLVAILGYAISIENPLVKKAAITSYHVADPLTKTISVI